MAGVAGALPERRGDPLQRTAEEVSPRDLRTGDTSSGSSNEADDEGAGAGAPQGPRPSGRGGSFSAGARRPSGVAWVGWVSPLMVLVLIAGLAGLITWRLRKSSTAGRATPAAAPAPAAVAAPTTAPVAVQAPAAPTAPVALAEGGGEEPRLVRGAAGSRAAAAKPIVRCEPTPQQAAKERLASADARGDAARRGSAKLGPVLPGPGPCAEAATAAAAGEATPARDEAAPPAPALARPSPSTPPPLALADGQGLITKRRRVIQARRGIRISALQLGEADALLSGPTWGDFATAVGVADEAAPAAAPTPPPLPPVEEPEEQPGDDLADF